MTLFPVKNHSSLKKRPITKRNMRAIMPCTHARAEEVFIGKMNPDSKDYKRLLTRLNKIWYALQ